jgi:hypothetical protein
MAEGLRALLRLGSLDVGHRCLYRRRHPAGWRWEAWIAGGLQGAHGNADLAAHFYREGEVEGGGHVARLTRVWCLWPDVPHP